VAANQPTPAIQPSGSPSVAHPILHQINVEIGQHWRNIWDDRKNGKLTPDQAAALDAKLKEIHNQKVAFLKSNGVRELTTEQAAQLHQQMQTIAQSIP
jgi:hypothetical protein